MIKYKTGVWNEKGYEDEGKKFKEKKMLAL